MLARVPTISGGSLGHNANKAWCPEHRVELGVEFALISKRCTHFAHFCTGKPIVMGSPSGATTVVEELVKIRDKAWGHMRSGITVDGDDQFGSATAVKRSLSLVHCIAPLRASTCRPGNSRKTRP